MLESIMQSMDRDSKLFIIELDKNNKKNIHANTCKDLIRPIVLEQRIFYTNIKIRKQTNC